MLLLGWLFRIVLVLLVLRLVGRFVLGFIEGLQGIEPRQRGSARVRDAKAVALVKDPVCGTYVVPERSLVSRTGGAANYFCSEACRTTFERSGRTSRTA